MNNQKIHSEHPRWQQAPQYSCLPLRMYRLGVELERDEPAVATYTQSVLSHQSSQQAGMSSHLRHRSMCAHDAHYYGGPPTAQSNAL
jgi:hypothetical protein